MSTESDLSRQASNWDNMYNFQNLTMGSCAQNEAQRQNITVPFLTHFFLKGGGVVEFRQPLEHNAIGWSCQV